MRPWVLPLLALLGCARPAPPAAAPHLPPADTSGPPPSEDDAAVPITGEDPVWGSRTAPVTIVEFSDFECARCAEMEIEIDELKQRYGKEGLRVVFKHFPDPIHANARAAAEAAQGVMELSGSQAFWTFHELAFTTEDELAQGRYEEWAALSGADVNALRSGLTAHRWTAKVTGDQLLATQLGASTPPAVFVNGAPVGDELLAKLVESERLKADRELERGTAPASVYRAMAAANRGSVPH